MRTITIPIDLPTALQLIEPELVLVRLVVNEPGISITVEAMRVEEVTIPEAADPPPGTEARAQVGSEGAGGEECHRVHLRTLSGRQVREPAGARRAPTPPAPARRRCPSALIHTDQAVRHRPATHQPHARRAARTHEAVLDVTAATTPCAKPPKPAATANATAAEANSHQ